MKCIKCGADNPENSKFCLNCGTKLEEELLDSVSQNNSTNSNEITEQPKIEETTPIEETKPKEENVAETPQQPAPVTPPPAVQTQPKKKGGAGKIILIIVAIVGFIFIIAAILIVLLLSKGTTSRSGDVIFDLNAPIKIEKNEKYGFIDTKGKVIIEPTFAKAEDFSGKFAYVKSSGSDEKYMLIDKKGNVKLTSEYGFDYNVKYDYWVVDDKMYDGNLKQITSDNVKVDYSQYNAGYLGWKNSTDKTAGILNPKGKVTYKYKLNSDIDNLIVDLSDSDDEMKEKYCALSLYTYNNGKSVNKDAIVNCDTGKVIYNYSIENIYVRKNNIFSIGDSKKIYIQNDKIIFETTDKNVDLRYYDDGYIEIRDYNKDYNDKDRYKYIDIKTGKIVDEQPKNDEESLSDLDKWEKETGLKSFKCNDGYGIMNKDKVVIQCEWDKLRYFGIDLYNFMKSRGKEYVIGTKEDEKVALINLKTGKEVFSVNSTSIRGDDASTFLYSYDEKTRKLFIYNMITNKSITLDNIASNDKCILGFNYIVVQTNNNKDYYNINLKKIYTS